MMTRIDDLKSDMRSVTGWLFFFAVLIFCPGSVLVADESSQWPAPTVTRHEVTIGQQRVVYTASAGMGPVHDEGGKHLADLFYVYYKRVNIENGTNRPLLISFNGGPGSASVWMHIGYTGPKRLNLDPEGFPVQPYGVSDNPHSVLDVADIVYIDPVNTGFSRPLPDVDPAQFFGVYEDITYLAAWIEQFVTRHQRWASPKILIGESYGTTRVAGLSRQLQSAHRLYVDGVILVSPTGMGIKREGPIANALLLPHYAATAWYHQRLAPDLQQRDLEALLPEVETFALDIYLPALLRGGFLDAASRSAIASQAARYAGVSSDFVLENNLEIPLDHWRKELLREQRRTVGRLDARYLGVDRDSAGIRYDYDPALTAWNQAFTPAINIYLREQLQFDTPLSYNIFGKVSPWERDEDRTAEDLRRSMAENPWLKVMFQVGYYDGGTDYFAAKQAMWAMDPSGAFQDRFRFHAYRSGHMMYLRDEDLPTSNGHIREFLGWVIEGTRSKPAQYKIAE